ncbi:MAG: hypothetical protein K0R57_4812 [Paenibacillaceae bacterium]|jgi:putative DNA primase/helicase|nr:hypothetical protein [Paenibacillaceae bacterium]
MAEKNNEAAPVGAGTASDNTLSKLILSLQEPGKQMEKMKLFYEAAFPDKFMPENGFITICYSLNSNFFIRFFRPNQREEMLTLINSLNGKANIYYGTSPQDMETALLKNPRSRGSTETSLTFNFFHVDIDVDIEGHHKSNGKKLFPHLEVALTFAWNGIPLTPTIIVSTGGGLHLYFFIDEPMVLKTDSDRMYANKLLIHFQQWIRELAGEYGASTDTTADLARLLRAPFTYNLKTPDKKLADIVEVTNRRYSINEIERQLPVVEHKKSVTKRLPFSNRRKRSIEHYYQNCPFVRWVRDYPNEVSYPQWFAALSHSVHCYNGYEESHKLSREYDRYSETETDKKVIEALKGKPNSCRYIAQTLGSKACIGCSRNPVISKED